MNDEFCALGFLPFYLSRCFLIWQNPDLTVLIYVNSVGCCCTPVGVWALAMEAIPTLPLHRFPGVFYPPSSEAGSWIRGAAFHRVQPGVGPPLELFVLESSRMARAEVCFTGFYSLWLRSLLWSVLVCVFPCCLSQPKHAESKSKASQRSVMPTMPRLVKSLWAKTPAIAATSCVGAARSNQNQETSLLKRP